MKFSQLHKTLTSIPCDIRGTVFVRGGEIKGFLAEVKGKNECSEVDYDNDKR